MNSLSTEEPSTIIQISFFEHQGFSKKIKKTEKKISGLRGAIDSLKKLLQKQFNPNNPLVVITPKNLHCITKAPEYELWKVNCVATKGLRRSQMPRIYFMLRGLKVYLLCMGTHIDNYKDSELEKVAYSRLEEVLGI